MVYGVLDESCSYLYSSSSYPDAIVRNLKLSDIRLVTCFLFDYHGRGEPAGLVRTYTEVTGGISLKVTVIRTVTELVRGRPLVRFLETTVKLPVGYLRRSSHNIDGGVEH